MLNLVKFVEWSSAPGLAPGAPIVIGVVGPDPFRGTLEEAVADLELFFVEPDLAEPLKFIPQRPREFFVFACVGEHDCGAFGHRYTPAHPSRQIEQNHGHLPSGWGLGLARRYTARKLAPCRRSWSGEVSTLSRLWSSGCMTTPSHWRVFDGD